MKWYSNSFDMEKVQDLVKLYAKVLNASYMDKDCRECRIDLRMENRAITSTMLDQKDLSYLLAETNSKDFLELRGRVIETYWALKGELKCLSVNKSLALA